MRSGPQPVSMHFVEAYLMRHPEILFPLALALYALNLWLYSRTDRRRDQVPAWQSSPALPLRARLGRTVIGTVVMLGAGLALTDELRALFAGAFLVMQLVSLAALLADRQMTNTLLMPGAAIGQVSFTTWAQSRFAAAQVFKGALFCLSAYLLTASPSFFGAAFYLAMTSIGYRRRARQYAAKAGAGTPTPAA